MDLVSFEVFINENLTITIETDRESAERAFRDSAYLEEITNKELNKLNKKTATKIKDLSESESNEKENNYVELSQCENEERNISFWAVNDTHLLLTLYKEKEEDLQKGRLRQGQFWKNIAKEINRMNPKNKKTAIQCSNKMSCLKRTYKNIKDYNNKSGNDRKTWSFYEEMDEIFGNRAWITPNSLASEAGPSSSSSCSSLSPNLPKSSKRKREGLLDELISQNKIHHKEQNMRNEKKIEMFKKFREERLQMHKEKINMQQKLLDVMTKLYSANKEK